MIALKTNHMMSSDILSFDSALLSPTEQSFFSDDYPQTQHCSEITSQASDEWLLDFEDIPIPFCDGLELGLIYEPELSLEAMTKEVDTQYQITEDERIDYLDSSAFLSPVSIEPSSPPQQAEQDTGFDSEAAISLLEEILVANSNGNSPSEQCYDELTIPFAEDTEVSTRSPSPEPEKRIKRQTKRKAQESESIPKPKPTKRSKSSVEAKRERKRSQNKCAANRYRQKKRAELDVVENQLQDYEDTNAKLKAQLQKLQMEFKVVYPLAKAAFASDPNRSLQLQMLDIRVLNHEVLD